MKTILLVLFVLTALQRVSVCQSSNQMPQTAHPTFEVVTVKPSDPLSKRQGINFQGHLLNARGQTVESLMMFAFGVHSKQLVDEPGWMKTDRFDISGVPSVPGEPNLRQMQELFQKVLTDRFGLHVRHERRNLSYYALVRTAGFTGKAFKREPDEMSPDQNGVTKGIMKMQFTANLMSDFALGMNYFTDRPIIDETNLPGRYDFALSWLPDGSDDAGDGSVPGLFKALQEQLGLQLKPAKGPVEVIAIQELERPSAN